jgi:hypothetical protein
MGKLLKLRTGIIDSKMVLRYKAVYLITAFGKIIPLRSKKGGAENRPLLYLVYIVCLIILPATFFIVPAAASS